MGPSRPITQRPRQGEDVEPDNLEDGLAALAELGSVDYARTMAESFHAKAHACLNRLEDNPALVAPVNSPIFS